MPIGSIELFIPIVPTAQGRPRIVSINGHASAYDPHRKEKELFRRNVKANLQAANPFSCAISIEITFCLPIPKSYTATKKNLARWNALPHTKKGDIDNYCKFLLDSLNGIAYEDDSQIVSLISKKVYSDMPGTKVSIRPHYELEEHQKHLLSLLSPEDIKSIMESLKKLSDVYNLEHSNENIDTLELMRIADTFGFISKRYSKTFAQIAKKWPEVWGA